MVKGERIGDEHGELALPPGLTLRRKGESIESIASKGLEAELLVAGRGLEIHRATIDAGERLFLFPSGEVLEAFYLLEGKLRFDTPRGPIAVGVGDYLVSDALEEQVILSAEQRTTFFYVTSRPTFHEVSQHLKTLMDLVVEIEVKDGYTADHCWRIQQLSYATGQVLGLDPGRLFLLDRGAYLHDIGKTRLPLDILRKPDELSEEEWRIVEQHPIYGREMLEGTLIAEAGLIVEQHHERFDGSGYPYRLAGDEILVEAYIVAVADTYDAMTTERPYRRPVTHEQALAEIRRSAGSLFPAEVVAAFLKALSTLK